MLTCEGLHAGSFLESDPGQNIEIPEYLKISVQSKTLLFKHGTREFCENCMQPHNLGSVIALVLQAETKESLGMAKTLGTSFHVEEDMEDREVKKTQRKIKNNGFIVCYQR